jgi:hypothetical protein
MERDIILVAVLLVELVAGGGGKAERLAFRICVPVVAAVVAACVVGEDTDREAACPFAVPDPAPDDLAKGKELGKYP